MDSTSAEETLTKLNYYFDSELRLRRIGTGAAFEFINQAHYEELADAVSDYIQDVMVKDYGMIKVNVPLLEHLNSFDKQDREIYKHIQCPIFVSSNLEKAEIVLILLCGSGRVSSGQWARSLCINDSLKTGSVIPFLDWAKEHSFGVVVLNPNKNVIETTEGLYRIPFNETSEAHVEYAWKAMCKDLPAKHFVIVAHSYGGVSSMNLLKHHGMEVLERLRCIALTDSVHSSSSVKSMSEEAMLFLSRHCTNWASSEESLDTVIENPPLNQKDLECNQRSETGSARFNNAKRKKKNHDQCNLSSTEIKNKYSNNLHRNITKTDEKHCLNVSNGNDDREHAGQFEAEHEAGCSSVNCTEDASQEENGSNWPSDSNDLPKLLEQVATIQTGSKIRTSESEHADGVKSAHDGKKEKNYACRSSDLNNLPKLLEQVATIQTGSNIRTSESEHADGVKSARDGKKENSYACMSSDSNDLLKLLEQVATIQTGSNVRTSEREHADGVKSAQDGKTKRNYACRSSDLNDLPKLLEQVATIQTGSNIRTSEREHADGVKSAHDGKKEKNYACRSSDSNDLPKLLEQVATIQTGSNIRTSESEHADGVISVHDGKKEKSYACRSSDSNDLPGLSAHSAKKRKRTNRKTRRKISDWFRTYKTMCKVVSAGTDVHEKTTMSAFLSIQKFLLQSLRLAGAAIEVH